MSYSCIYCGKSRNTNTEHVIPRLMGKFINTPTIIGFVCIFCNSEVFKKLENEYKIDTPEGITYQMFNFDDKYKIRIRGRRVEMICDAGFKDKFFDDMFPFLKVENGKIGVDAKPQIKVKRQNGYYEVYLIDKLEKYKNNEKVFNSIKEEFKGTESKNISIFTWADHANDETHMKAAKDLVKEYGIVYKEGQGKYASFDQKNQRFWVTQNCTVDRTIARVIAKIAFNYFSYCAISDEKIDVLYSPFFLKIKAFILGDESIPLKEVVVNLKQDPILIYDKEKNTRFVAHQIVFYEKNGCIFSELTFMGRMVYEVNLGFIPFELNLKEFGSGHLFDPASGRISQLTQNRKKEGTMENPNYGLFQRV